MKLLFVLSLTLNSFIFTSLSQAQVVVTKGEAIFVHLDADASDQPSDTLVLNGDAAGLIFSSMTQPKSQKIYHNSCFNSSGKQIEVNVEQKTGVAFGCEKWPADCGGKVFYKCESRLETLTGAASARQSN